MNEHDDLMQRITTALETSPRIAAPPDFSARLMARLPQAPRRRTLQAMPLRSQYGWLSMQVMLAVMMLGMVCAAIFVRQSSVWLLVEDLLFLQFGALSLWMALSRRRVS